MTDGSQLAPSPTWRQLAAAIGRQFRAGVPFDQIHEMNIVIAQRTLEPYQRHRRRLDELLWHDDPGPKTIIDLGAGYGAMAGAWPEGSTIYNVDLPEMLEIQQHYIYDLSGALHLKAQEPVDLLNGCSFDFVPIAEADRIPVAGAYLFSVWALTETTRAAWAYWTERAPQLAGAYLLGYKQWTDETEPWPWREMADAFKTVRGFWDVEPDSYELAAVNR
jgi:hypothetical protein